ncbi:class I SAM-dependent methyltransferase [Patulibacter sp. NPDC049589]|uniref:class I SAM-dependent methyltransferase n=1 Tax=Patulibacter sp. NPDC049589 TaxID=3154731 RepID=UPI003445843A
MSAQEQAVAGPADADRPATAGDPAILDRWDAQQAAYIAGREQRFAAMLDVLELTVGPEFVAIDLACGPGSLSARILDRFPGARVVACDVDPLLLHVAREVLGPRFGERLTVLDVDLAEPGWSAVVAAAAADLDPASAATRADRGPASEATLADRRPTLDDPASRPSAVLSTTALHWLLPQDLVRVYGEAHALLADGGVLLNGDHLRFDGRDPELRRIAAAHDAATQRAAFAAGAPTWDAWWGEARALPGGAALAEERERRFAGRPVPPATAVDLHLAALAQAGFATVGTAWQLLDDYVVLGRR